MSNPILEQGLVVIFRGVPLEKMAPVCKALYRAGVRVMEVAFNPSDENTIETTQALIRRAYESVGDDAFIGAGTVVKKEYVQAAYDAGAKFVYAPDTNVEIIKETKKLGMLSIPGAYTPTEMTMAYNAGADIVKLFPITVNEIGYIKNIARPLSHIPFLCTGGTNEDTIEAFITAGAVGVGTGISILKPELIETENYDEIERLAKLHLDRVKEARSKL